MPFRAAVFYRGPFFLGAKGVAGGTIMASKTPAVVLVSGGLDSMVSAARAREDGHPILALSIDYNQRHRVELDAARRIATDLADEHIVLPMDLRAFGGSALTSDIAVPKDGVAEAGIPVGYTNVFWGGRSEIKPSEISPIEYARWCARMGIDADSMCVSG